MCKYKAYVKMYVTKEIEFDSVDIFWAEKRAAREMKKLLEEGVGGCKVQHAELAGLWNKDTGFSTLYTDNKLTMSEITKIAKNARRREARKAKKLSA